MLKIFLTKGGRDSPNPTVFFPIFGTICQKLGFLYKVTGSSMTIFRWKRGGVGRVKKSLSVETDVVKGGEGGVSVFLL